MSRSRAPAARAFLALAVLALRPALPVHADSPASPQETRGSFVVGIAAFSSPSADMERSLFLSALPRLVVAGLDPLPPRFEDEGYGSELRRRQAILSTYSLGADLARCLDDLALRRLEPGIDPYKRAQAVAEAEKKAEGARSKLEKAGGVPPEGSGRQGPRTSTLAKENLSGELVEVGEGGAAAAAKRLSLDLLVTGEVEDVGSYVSVSVSGWDSALSREVFSWKGYGSRDDPGPLADEISRLILREVAGRPFARLDLVASPESARIEVDGKEVTQGLRSLFFFAPARVRVSATASGKDPAEAEVALVPGERKEARFDLADSVVERVRVLTRPEGLSVFLNGLPAGKSPLELGIGEGRSVVSAYDAKGEGSRAIVSARVAPTRDKAGTVREVLLEPRAGSEDEAATLLAAKRSFYEAFGWFVLSVPALSLSWGLANTYAEAADTSSGTGAATLRDNAYAATSILAAGTLALATNAVLRFIRYIRTVR